MQKIADYLIRKHGLHDSFYMVSMAALQNKIQEWRTYLPQVQPFYAVKCNPNEVIIKHMIENNFGFDAASQHEIDTVLRLGASPKQIIYAHPYKRTYELEHAVNHNVTMTTFDSVSELEKIKKHAPNINCLMRLRVDNPLARVQLGLKYGVRKDEYKALINYAKELNINLAGASFHVGSASKDPNIFKEAINYSKEVFDYAKEKGFIMSVLDIGGGFTGQNFKECAQAINETLPQIYPSPRIIAEPGRYFAEETFTFVIPIIGQRTRDNIHEYWLADGLYGSFNCMLYDGQAPTFKVLRNPLLPEYKGSQKETESIIYGQTCDSFDSLGKFTLPYLRNGDFLIVENFGAYTIAGAMNFNGINMANPKLFYI